MAFALVGLGANLGDRTAVLEGAVRALENHPHIAVVRSSSFHETAAVGGPEHQPAFLNGAVLLESSLLPRELLSVLQSVELQFGRTREVRWDARPLDLDLLLYDDLMMSDTDLTLPHPRMAYRRFVLAPAAEAAPEMRHPQIGWTVAELLENLNAAPNYLAITGFCGGTTELAEGVAETSGAAFCRDLGRSLDSLPSDAPALSQQRAESLRECLARSPHGVVSDFWIQQQRVYADSGPVAPPHLANTADGVELAPEPKLLVVLDDGRRAQAEDRPSLQDRLLALATSPGRGPFLVLNLAAVERNVEELTAAFAAMQ